MSYFDLWLVVLLFFISCGYSYDNDLDHVFKMFENSKSTEVMFARENNDTIYFYSLSRIYGWISIAITNWITRFIFNIPVRICSRAESTNRDSKNYLTFSLTYTNLTLLESLPLPESEYKHLFVEKIMSVMGGLGIWDSVLAEEPAVTLILDSTERL